MRYLLVYFCSIFLIACNNDDKRKFISVKKGQTVMKGVAIRDSIFDDTVFYYNEDDKLLRKELFENGKVNGISINYYENGNPMIVEYYANGLKNGLSIYFDSLGLIKYKGFYYYDLAVGPIIYFHEDQQPKRYFFTNLQNETLLDITYEGWKGVESILEKTINFTSNYQQRDSIDELSLLIYLINPPKFSFEYLILKKKKNLENDFSEVMKLSNDMPFKNLILEQLPLDENYTVGLTIYDSLQKRKVVVYKDVE